MGLIFAIYVGIFALLCFAGSKQTGKLRTRLRRWFTKQFFGKKH
jgi:hypothetical protein